MRIELAFDLVDAISVGHLLAAYEHHLWRPLIRWHGDEFYCGEVGFSVIVGLAGGLPIPAVHVRPDDLEPVEVQHTISLVVQHLCRIDLSCKVTHIHLLNDGGIWMPIATPSAAHSLMTPTISRYINTPKGGMS
jgi:hypothetical protein